MGRQDSSPAPMAPLRRNEPIATWQDGDTVQGFALLARKEVRRDRNGKDYLDLELADSSGSILAKAWSDTPAIKNALDAQRFVAFKGVVRPFRESRQLHLDDCREATEEDRKYGFDENRLIPTTPEDIDAGMKLGCNQPIGPLALADMIGLDVCLAVMEVYLTEFGDSKYRPCPLLKEMVAAGRLGRKTGRGVYSY